MLKLSVDAGNFNIKTPNGHIFPAGIYPVTTADLYNDTITCNGRTYALSNQVLPLIHDRTQDENMRLLTLIAMAKQLEDVKGESFNVELSVGLPPIQYNAFDLEGNPIFRNGLVKYYLGDYDFIYNKRQLKIFVEKVNVYPQGFSALFGALDDSEKPYILSLANEANVILVDIGGGTVDLIGLEYGNLSADLTRYTSLNLGFNDCYGLIRNEIRALTGGNIQDIAINEVIKGRPGAINQQKQDIIKRHVRDYIEKLVKSLKLSGLNIEDSFVIFMGGVAATIQEQLEKCGISTDIGFITDICASAKGYEVLSANI
jgi:plasmid segregation protein ParM